ncbi:cache domain-containing protein [Paenibacillus puldeungensis]|uniref:histidine kinase n=1 Tax=Paenibacillus puldeungensis TaxID=696536 RepID=A0ABW3RYI6_9BACL
MNITAQFLIITLLILTIAMLAIYSISYEIAKRQVLNFGEEMLEHKLKETIGFLDAMNQRVEAGDMKLEEAQEMVKVYLLGPKNPDGSRDLAKSKMSSSEYMYVWAIRPDGTMEMHPSNYEGRNLWNMNIEGKYIVRDTWTNPAKWGHVFRENFERPGEPAYTSIAYEEYYAPWDWIVGAGGREGMIYKQRLDSMKSTFLWVMGGLFLAAFTLIVLFCRRLIYKLDKISSALNEVSRGNLKQNIHFRLQDEFSVLADSFNQMVDQLKNRMEHDGSQPSINIKSKQYLRQLSESESRLIKLTNYKVLHAQEEERKRISRDLHDGIGQVLYSVIVALRLVNRDQEFSDTKMQKYLMNVEASTTQAIYELKTIINELRPTALEKYGLIPAIKTYISTFETKWRMAVHFDENTNRRRYPPEIETAVYRVFQEALLNAGKYSKSDEIIIVLREREQALEIIIQDFGVGFNISEKSLGVNGLGFGLYGMKERVILLNGTFNIDSELGLGTKIDIIIPISEE